MALTRRGELYWADFGPAIDHAPAKVRPVIVLQADRLNDTRLGTVVVAPLTTNTTRAELPTQVFVPGVRSGLKRDSLIDLTGLRSFDKRALEGPIGRVPDAFLAEAAAGLRLVLDL